MGEGGSPRRQTWRSKAEVFSVWFALLGRLASLAIAGEPEDGKWRRRSFGAGLLQPILHLVEAVRSDDGFNLLHDVRCLSHVWRKGRPPGWGGAFS